LRHNALCMGLIMDTAQLNVGFIEQCIDKEKYGKVIITSDDAEHFAEKTIPLIKQYLPLIVLFYLLSSIVLYTRQDKNSLSFFLYNMVGWWLIFLIGCKLRVYVYFFEPWVEMIFGGTAWLLLRNDRWYNYQKAI